MLVSIVLEDFRGYWRSMVRHGRPPEGKVGSRVMPPEAVIAQQGGRLLEIRWDPPRIVSERALPTPAGFDRVGSALWVASAWTNSVTVIEGETQRQVSHPLLNDAHGLEADAEGVLVACAGSDAVVDLVSGWSWHARGESVDVLGEPLQRHEDYRGHRIPTLHRALQINSVIRHQGRVLATSLHRGAVLSLEDAGAIPVLDGLAIPHGLRPDGDGLLLCESRRGRVVTLDSEVQVTGHHGELRWVQDADRAPDGRLFALDVPDLIRPDRVPSRVVELSTGEALELPEGWRPHTIRAWDA